MEIDGSIRLWNEREKGRGKLERIPTSTVRHADRGVVMALHIPVDASVRGNGSSEPTVSAFGSVGLGQGPIVDMLMESKTSSVAVAADAVRRDTSAPSLEDHDGDDNAVSGSVVLFPLEQSPEETDSGAVPLVASSIWAFFPSSHIPYVKLLLLGYFLVGVLSTLGAMGYLVATRFPAACEASLKHFLYAFAAFGVGFCIVLPLWSVAFFRRILEALQRGLQPFVQPEDRDLTIGLVLAVLGETAAALYGLSLAPPKPRLLLSLAGSIIGVESEFDEVDTATMGSGDDKDCMHPIRVVRFSSWTWLAATAVVVLLYAARVHALRQAQKRFSEHLSTQAAATHTEDTPVD